VNTAIRTQLIQQYSDGPAELRRAWDAAPDAARDWKPAPDAWSMHEVIIHCADSETAAATRIRMLASEPRPTIVGYDQDAWVTIFNYVQVSTDLAFAAISAVRALTTHVIRRFTDDKWKTSGTHSESGPYSAEDWLRTYAAHLHEHAGQIRSNLALWELR